MLSCPFCKIAFATASGVVDHLLIGACACAPALDRDTVLRMVSDPHGLIANKIIEDPKERGDQYHITPRAFNGTNWECYICHKEFNSVRSLRQHMDSPVHQQKVYPCPNVKACGKRFVGLAGLFDHLESESCGIERFEQVEQV
jgi:hypothetical protein